MKKKEQNIIFIILATLSISLIILDKVNTLNWLKSIVQKTTNPFRAQIYKNKVLQNKQQKAQNLQKEQLMQKVVKLQAQNANLKNKLNELEKENQDMKKLLGAPFSPSWQFTNAKVLSINNNQMTINIGSNNGIKSGQSVVWENNLVGRINKVQPHLSQIILPTNNQEKIYAKISSTQVKGIVQNNQDQLQFTNVLQEKELKKDQIVVTSGEKQIYLEGIIIGKITEVEQDKVEVYKKAIITPIIEFENLTNVFIVSP